MVTLPDGVDACDIGTITIWCQPFRAIFTRLAIPRSTFVSMYSMWWPSFYKNTSDTEDVLCYSNSFILWHPLSLIWIRGPLNCCFLRLS